jgi:hypothetical protein
MLPLSIVVIDTIVNHHILRFFVVASRYILPLARAKHAKWQTDLAQSTVSYQLSLV